MKRYILTALFALTACFAFSQTYNVSTTGNHNNPYWLISNVLVDPNFIVYPTIDLNTGLPIPQPSTNQVGIFNFSNNTGVNAFPIDSGIVMCTDWVTEIAPGFFGSKPQVLENPKDQDLAGVWSQIGTPSTTSMYDFTEIFFSFVATSDSISFNYVFGSREYASYTCTQFNDVFGFFLEGNGINGNINFSKVNLASIPNTSTPVAINTINAGAPSPSGSAAICLAANPNYVANSVYFAGNPTSLELTGITQKFTASAQVTCGNSYTIYLKIANAGDGAFDSAVFLEAQSFSAPSINITPTTNTTNSFQDSTIVEGCAPSYLKFEKERNINVGMGINLVYSGNALNGIDVTTLPDSLWIAPNVKADSLMIEAFDDGLVEPNDSLVITMQPVTTSCYVYPPQQVVLHLRDKQPVVANANVVASLDTIYCPGDTASITASFTGGEGILNGWWADDSVAAPTRIVQPTQTTTYYYYATDECASDTAVDSVTIYLANYVPMTYNVDSALICLGDTATFTLNIQNGNPPYYVVWPDSSNALTFSDSPRDTTYYPFTILDQCGVKVTDSMLINVAPDPLAAYVFQNDLTIPLRVHFSNRSKNAASYFWDFGDGNTSTDENPIYDFPAPGTYNVTLSIVSDDGCADDIILEVVVKTDFYLYVPTAFTPDGDGLNECFEIQGTGFESYEIKIFDRWGNQVFYANDIADCWDGTTNGQPAQQAVYTYTIFLRLPFDKIDKRTGMVTLYR